MKEQIEFAHNGFISKKIAKAYILDGLEMITQQVFNKVEFLFQQYIVLVKKYLSSALRRLCNISTWLGYTSFSKIPFLFLGKLGHQGDSNRRPGGWRGSRSHSRDHVPFVLIIWLTGRTYQVSNCFPFPKIFLQLFCLLGQVYIFSSMIKCLSFCMTPKHSRSQVIRLT